MPEAARSSSCGQSTIGVPRLRRSSYPRTPGGSACLRHVADDDKLADGGECLPDGLEERPDTGTDEEHTIFRVVNNVGNVLTAPLTMRSPRLHLAFIKM